MFGSIGKFVRHYIAVACAAAVAALLPLVGLEPTMFEPGAYEGFTSVIETIVWATLSGVVYPTVEKFLKRFRWLDPEGWIDRLWLKDEAAQPTLQSAQRRL